MEIVKNGVTYERTEMDGRHIVHYHGNSLKYELKHDLDITISRMWDKLPEEIKLEINKKQEAIKKKKEAETEDKAH